MWQVASGGHPPSVTKASTCSVSAMEIKELSTRDRLADAWLHRLQALISARYWRYAHAHDFCAARTATRWSPERGLTRCDGFTCHCTVNLPQLSPFGSGYTSSPGCELEPPAKRETRSNRCELDVTLGRHESVVMASSKTWTWPSSNQKPSCLTVAEIDLQYSCDDALVACVSPRAAAGISRPLI
jgi:hypothetical protein